MTADTGYHQRDENPHQGASHSFGRPTERAQQGGGADAARTGEADRAARTPADQERSIRTNREGERSLGIGRRRGGASLEGSLYGTATPLTLMRRMAEDMDRLFENFGLGRTGLSFAPSLLGTDPWRDLPATTAAWTPQVETFRRGDQLVVRADLPGMKKDDVNVEVEDGVLTITGERTDEHRDERDDYFVSERSYGQFYRAIPLPEGITEEQCDASFKDGVLEVTFPAPKDGQRRGRKIPVR